jgi:myxalamid-type polyketide synthase MxaE and MxaD
LAPKLSGALVLDRLLPELDLFVVFSSISAFWAPPGMSNYSAANAGLDALAARRRARGQHALSIQWGPWAGIGLHESAISARSSQEMERTGVGSIPVDSGTALFAALLARQEPVITVLPVDWATYRNARAGRDWSLFRALSGTSATSPTGGFTERVRSAPPATRRSLVDGVVREALAAVIRRPANQLDSRRSFGSMGLDSLMALELRNRLETAAGRSLPASLAWNYPTIEQLAAYLEGQVVPEPTPDAAAAASVAPELDDIQIGSLFKGFESLSDEDAARALRGGAEG